MPPGNAAKRQKALMGFVRSGCFGVLLRGLQNLEASLKGFNCCGAKLRLRRAESRFGKPRSFLQRGRFYILFASCKKNQKARGAKPCDPRFKALPEVSLQSFSAARIETGFAHKTPAKRL